VESDPMPALDLDKTYLTSRHISESNAAAKNMFCQDISCKP